MLPYSWYLLKVIICSGILFGYYWFFLRNKIFHRYNRFYLMASIGLSLVLPLLKIDFWQSGTDKSQAIRVLRAVADGDVYMDSIVVTGHRSFLTWNQVYPLVYLLVSLVLFFVMIRTLYLIRTLLKKYPVQQIEEVNFVNTEDDSTPFSFLKYIFWNRNIDLDTATGRQIFKHEVAHIQEKHTHDKLFVNIVLIFFWSNPFFWLYRKELNMIHEFIADKKAVEDSDTAAFAAMILKAAYPRHRFELTNNFFYSPIKRRLMMLTKMDNPKISYIARVMVLPLALLVFAAFTFKAKNSHHLYHGKKITVVIDAGHGGQDGGATGMDGTTEKDLTLAVAKKIEALNSNNDIEIILTRSEDIFQAAKLKAEIAKEQNADLFISIHIDKTPTPNLWSGINFFVSGDQFENSEKSRVLASALISEFTGNYPLPVSASPAQRNAGVWVIQANNIPSVLIEAGFISNEKDLTYLKTDQAKETIAKNVLAGIEKFASSQIGGNSFRNENNKDSTPQSIFINAKYSDANYTKTEEFKYKALVIVDSKEIGNLGNDYVEKNGEKYSSYIVYNPAEAKKRYGNKGSYGVIKLTQKEAISITADTIFFDESNKTIKLAGDKTKTAGDLSNSLIYLDHKIITPEELNKIPPGKISSVNILNGKNINDIVDPKGKTSVIYVTLKPDDLPEVSVKTKLRQKEIAESKLTDGITISTTYTDKNGNAIFYIGLDNQLSVSSADIEPGDLVVTMSEGVSFTRISGNSYNVQVTTAGKKTLRLFHRNGTAIPGSFTINAQRVPDPTDVDFPEQLRGKLRTADQLPFVYLGPIAGGRISTDYLKKQKIRLLAGQRLLSGTVWFSGPGFGNHVVQLSLTENNLSDAEKYFNQCEDGAKIVFGNFSVVDENDVIHTVSPNPVFIAGLNNKSTDNDQAAVNSKDETPGNANKIFTVVEQSPEFTGGEEAWRKYLMANLKSIIPLDEGWSSGKPQVMVKFIVHSDGTVSDVTTENYQGTKTAQHCIDVIKNAPKWQPALQNGRRVNAFKKQPITFVVK